MSIINHSGYFLPKVFTKKPQGLTINSQYCHMHHLVIRGHMKINTIQVCTHNRSNNFKQDLKDSIKGVKNNSLQISFSAQKFPTATFSDWFVELGKNIAKLKRDEREVKINKHMTEYTEQLLDEKYTSKPFIRKLFRNSMISSLSYDLDIRKGDFKKLVEYLIDGEKPVNLGKTNIDAPEGRYSSEREYDFNQPEGYDNSDEAYLQRMVDRNNW